MQSGQTKACQHLAGHQMGGPTSENTAPYLILLSITLAVDSLISVEYSFNKLSRLWSDAGRDPDYGNVSSWAGVRSCEDTDINMSRESQIHITMVLSNGNGLCVPRSEMGEMVGGCNGPDTRSSRLVELQ